MPVVPLPPKVELVMVSLPAALLIGELNAGCQSPRNLSVLLPEKVSP